MNQDRDAILDAVRAGIDWAAHQRLAEQFRDTVFGKKKSHYVDLERTVARDVDEAIRLGLVGSTRKRILDIGTGSGAFPYVLRNLGHDVVATDSGVNESTKIEWHALRSYQRWYWRLTRGRKAMSKWMAQQPSLFTETQKLLGIDCGVWTVMAHEHAPDFGSRFDLVSARALFFDVPGPNRTWGLSEWRFFVGDVGDNLLGDTGSLYLMWVQNRPGIDHIIAAFAEAGARIEGHRVLADRDVCLRFADA